MKKIFTMIFALALFLFFSNRTFAFEEIGDYGVNVDYYLEPTTEYEIRRADYTITDKGRMTNPYDTINFNGIYNGKYNLSNLISEGYKTVVVELSFEAFEINDGYQYVLIYADDTTSTYITGGKLDIPNSYNNGNTDKYTLYFEAQIASFELRNSFVIRYGASGAGKDTWINRILKVQVGFSYDAMKTANMWRLRKNGNNTYSYTQLELAR